jgi:hypothetical protein
MDTSSPKQSWEELLPIAKRTVDALISRLPDELRPEAIRIGYELRKRCWDEDDILGDYGLPAQLITLYLESIRDHCAAKSLDFCSEVEKTYLHEFGHHLGLGEGDLENRGL